MRNKIIALLIIIALAVGLVALWLVFNPQNAESDAVSAERIEITRERGYKGVLTVYDESGEAAYKWYSSEEYIISAALSPRKETMAVLTLSGNGCRLIVFDLVHEGTENGSYVSTDALFYEVGYLTNSRIYALSDKKAVIADSGAEIISEYDYGEKELIARELANGNLTLTLDELSVGGSTVKVTYNGVEWK
ncbi:MAG: DUF5711 family protein [Oscillospiraceae bacterium]|jgi:hypothetical protein|nr:DUF5711 family protein [Oscillospiraceae bacterium]